MTTMIELIKKLRQETGAGVMDCRQALEQSNSYYEEALQILREKAAAKAADRAGRDAFQGAIELYSHGNGRIGVMVEVNCETDFAARSPVFREFTHELALHIAAAAPLWVGDTDIPADVLSEEAEKVEARVRAEGKPETLIPRIITGYLEKYKDQHVLLRQVSIRDENLTVAQMLANASASTGESIMIRRFARWELAAEV